MKKKKQTTRVEFKVVANPKQLVAIGKVMSKMDLGIEKVVQETPMLWGWTTTQVVNTRYINKMKKAIQKVSGIQYQEKRLSAIIRQKERAGA